MNSNLILMDLLNQLKLAALAPKFSEVDLLSAMENLLLWLNDSENNTNSNCKQIDHFISVEIISDDKFEEIPESIRSILFDMGATLHDTHRSPEIAENFGSTPAQLLTRVQNVYRKANGRDAIKEKKTKDD